MTPAGIEPATFRFVAQHLSHCASVVPNSTMYIMITGYEGQSWLELAQNIHWWVLSVALKFWDFLHIQLSKYFTIMPPLYYLPPSQSSKILNFMRIYHKNSLCISPSMLNTQTTAISFISLPYQWDKHSTFSLCNVLSPPSTLAYNVLHVTVQQIQFPLFP